MTAASALIGEARGYATSMHDAAVNALETARGEVEWAQFKGAELGFVPIHPGKQITPPKPVTPPEVPLHDLTEDDPPGPTPDLQDINSIVEESVGAVPINKTIKPTYDAPTKPNQLHEFRDTPLPIDTRLEIPTPVKWVNFAAPSVGSYTQPAPVGTLPLPSLPDTAVPPVPTAPTNVEGTIHSAYRTAAPEFTTMINGYVDAELTKLNPEFHNQMGKIEAQLAKYLEGGTGLKPAVEDAIYARARSKNDAEARRVRDQALADAATRGFTMPNGALLSATQQARQAGADLNAKAAAEIVVMQAEMEQKNLQFAVTTSTALRTAMVNATLSYMQNLGALNGQALDYAKAILGALVEAYNIAARAYSLQIERVKINVAIWDAQMKAAMARVTVYQAEVDAYKAEVQVDQAKVAMYSAQISSMQALATAYKSQIEAALGKVQMERAKIELFQAQVQSYGAEVNAKNGEWQAYSAAISGEESKVKAYSAEVQAFSSETQAFKTVVEAKKISLEGAVAVNQARSLDYTHKVEAYRASVSAHVAEMQGKVSAEAQKIARYGMQLQDVATQWANDAKHFTVNYEADRENARMDFDKKLKVAEMARIYQDTIVKISTNIAQIESGLAGAALAGMNALAVESATP